MGRSGFLISALCAVQLAGCDVLKDDTSSSDTNQCSNKKINDEVPEMASLMQSTAMSDAIPFQKWEKLGTTTEGILFAAGAQVWGGSFDHGGYISNGDVRKEYKYSANGFSPYALYFPSSGEGTNYIANWKVDTSAGQATYNAAMFEPQTLNGFGLSAAAHIVRLDVNGGKGGGGGVHFVATAATVIDGTADAPLNPVTAITEAKSKFEAHLTATAIDTANVDESALKDLLAKYGDAPADQASYSKKSYVGVSPSWHSGTKQLHVVFIQKSDSDYSKTVPNDETVDCPDGAPCMSPEPTKTITYHFETRVGVKYVFDLNGNLLSETTIKSDSKVSGLNNGSSENVSDQDDEDYDNYDDGLKDNDTDNDVDNKMPNRRRCN